MLTLLVLGRTTRWVTPHFRGPDPVSLYGERTREREDHDWLRSTTGTPDHPYLQEPRTRASKRKIIRTPQHPDVRRL